MFAMCKVYYYGKYMFAAMFGKRNFVMQEAFQSASVVFILDQWKDMGKDGGCGREENESPISGGQTEGGSSEEEKKEKEGEKEEGEKKEEEQEKEEGEKKEEKEKEKKKEGEKEEENKEEGEKKKEENMDEGEKEKKQGEVVVKEDKTESNLARELMEPAVLYHKYGAMLDFCAQKSVRVIVSGRLSNLGAAIIARSASSIPSSNIVASPCLTEQRTKSIIAERLKLNSADIEQVKQYTATEGLMAELLRFFDVTSETQ